MDSTGATITSCLAGLDMKFESVGYLIVEPVKVEEIKSGGGIILDAKHDTVIAELELGTVIDTPEGQDSKIIGSQILYSRYDAKMYSYFDKDRAKTRELFFLAPDKIIAYVS
jgi:hypothetical protein